MVCKKEEHRQPALWRQDPWVSLALGSPASRVRFGGIALVAACIFFGCVLLGRATGSGSLGSRGVGAAAVAVPSPTAKALAYSRTGTIAWALMVLWEIGVPAVLVWSGSSARLLKIIERRTRGRVWSYLLYVMAIGLVLYGTFFPIAVYAGYVRPHLFGLSREPFLQWFQDALKGFGLMLLASVALAWIPYGLMRVSPRRYWFWTWLLLVPAAVFLLWVQPVCIDPLFHHFQPLKNPSLQRAVLRLAQHAGIRGAKVWVVNQSQQTRALNGYVAGFGDTKRIVLWDTLIRKLDRPELLFVLGHEMGHYVLDHVQLMMGFLLLLALGLFWAMDKAARRLLKHCRRRFGFQELHDLASLPLWILLFNVGAFLLTPAAMAFSRHIEHEADRFALELTHANHFGAEAFVILQADNLSNPRPGLLYKLWRGSHPSLAERIRFCNSYAPWRSGKPLKYGKYFRKMPPSHAG